MNKMDAANQTQNTASWFNQAPLGYQKLFNLAPDALLILDAEGVALGKIIAANQAAAEEYGYPETELEGRFAYEMGESLTDSAYYLLQTIITEGAYTFEVDIHCHDGGRLPVEVRANTVEIDGHTYILSIGRDIHQRKKAEASLVESRERYALALDGSNDGIWDWDLRQNNIYFSQRWKVLLGYLDDEISSSPDEWLGRIHPDDVHQVKADLEAHIEGRTPHFISEHRILHKHGRYHWVLMRGLAVRDVGKRAHRIAGSLTDITDRKSLEERLVHDAMHDPLTRLPNRLYFTDQLRRSLERSKRHSENQGGVLVLNLDRFRIVNDSLGHLWGDEMLIGVGRRLQANLRPEDVVARFGQDEFVILLEEVHSIQDALVVVQRIQSELARPFNLRNHRVFTSASIGIVLTSAIYERADDVLRDADAAMHRAKMQGGACHQIFDIEMHEKSMDLLRLESELRRALEHQEFELVYQPIISLSNGEVSSVEALIRWNHPEKGLVMPEEFIPYAEESGLILPIGEWVLNQACKQVRLLIDAGFTNLSMAINISARQLQDPGFPVLLQQVMNSTGVNGTNLHLEITESAAMRDLEVTIQILEALCEMGVEISIDDFGTSYSSMEYLRRFPISRIKIDQSFVADITENADDAAITSAIIAMGHNLHLRVIAEGVESEQQLKMLMPQNCDEVQGYLFARPMQAELLMHQLTARGVDWSRDPMLQHYNQPPAE